MISLADAWPALALLGFVLLLPWLAGWLKRRGWAGIKPGTQQVNVVSVVAVGPQQKVVTVEVALGMHKKWLVLGVTPHSITTLDSLESPQPQPLSSTHDAMHT
jgi:flagellar protein FliO/FliZ